MSRFTKIYLCFVGVAFFALLYKWCGPEISDLLSESKKAQINNTIQHPAVTSALSTRDVVEEHIHISNRNCPLNVNNGFAQITGIFLNGNKITYMVVVQRELDRDIFKSQLKESINNSLLYMYVIFDGEHDEYLNAIIERRLVTVFKLQFPDGEISEFCFDSEDLTEKRDYVRSNREKALEEYVSNQIAHNNSYLPYKVEDGVIFQSMCKEGDFIICQLMVDSDTFNYIKSNSNQTREKLYGELKAYSRAILETCKVAHLGIKYNIVNQTTHKNIKYEYPYDLLMNDPFIRNLNMSEVKLF